MTLLSTYLYTCDNVKQTAKGFMQHMNGFTFFVNNMSLIISRNIHMKSTPNSYVILQKKIKAIQMLRIFSSGSVLLYIKTFLYQ